MKECLASSSPGVVHTPEGKKVIENFLYHICRCRGAWTASNFVEESIGRIRAEVGDGKVVCALSGGVDSAVAATLVHRAVGDQLTCVFVDNGLLRKEESQRVMETFERNLNMNIVRVDATEDFLTRLAGVTDPEQKRISIGEEFIRVFEEQAAGLGRVDFLAQGTLYPDVIESQDAGEQGVGQDQDPPQRGRLAGGYGLLTGRASPLPLQG